MASSQQGMQVRELLSYTASPLSSTTKLNLHSTLLIIGQRMGKPMCYLKLCFPATVDLFFTIKGSADCYEIQMLVLANKIINSPTVFGWVLSVSVRLEARKWGTQLQGHGHTLYSSHVSTLQTSAVCYLRSHHGQQEWLRSTSGAGAGST